MSLATADNHRAHILYILSAVVIFVLEKINLYIKIRASFRKNWTQSELNCAWKRHANFVLRGLFI